MMKNNRPTLERIDHLHVYTKDRDAAQRWYQDLLGFEIVEKYSPWADNGGPLVIQNQNKSVDLALFERIDFNPTSIIAFGVAGDVFLEWKIFFEQKGILDACKDHTLTWSLYFRDLDENGLEITTTDYEYVSEQML